jgi:hypothetical protein
MKRSTMHLVVAALDGPCHALAVALLREEFDGAVEPQLPLAPESRPMTPAERQAAYKSRKRSREVTAEVTEVTSPVTSSVTSPSVTSAPLSLSSFSDSSENSESVSPSPSGNAREPVTQVTASVTRLVTSPVTSPGHVTASPGERYLAVTDSVTPELVAIAEMVGVQDIAGAWLKFCGHYAGKWVHVAGAWQKWCVREAKAERTERDKAATKPTGGARRSFSDESYTPPPVSRKPQKTKLDVMLMGEDPAAHGIDPGAPELGTAISHPYRGAAQ